MRYRPVRKVILILGSDYTVAALAAVAAVLAVGSCARAADPDRSARVAAALAEAGPPVRADAAGCRPGDADCARRVRVALALAGGDKPAAAAKAAPCGCAGSCPCDPCPCDPCRCAAPKPMPPGDPPGVKWRADYASAMAEAAKDRKPVFCVVGDPVGCIDCRRLEAGALKDKGVLADLDGFVPVLVNAKAEPELARRLGAARWPHLIVADPDGTILATTTGNLAAAELREKLKAAKAR
jgi:hypothetical protein